MGEAKRRRERLEQQTWPRDVAFRGEIELHTLPAVPELNGARLRELTGDPMIPDADDVLLRAGKQIRTAIWDGRRNYAHELPADICRWVGGDQIAIVQVDSPVGVDRRSSLHLTHKLSNEFDGVVHWARDSETFQSILRSFVRLDLESVSPP
jgi:hypothetical protein